MLLHSGPLPEETHEVIVVGTGLAGLCAAIAAREAGAEALVLEKAPTANRGGNTRFSGGAIRHAKGNYSADDFYKDIQKYAKGRANLELVRKLVDKAAETVQWLTNLGVQWVKPEEGFDELRGRPLSQAISMPFEGHPGHGNGLVNMLADIAERKGAKIVYETKADQLLVDSKRRVIGVRALTKDGYKDLKSRGVVLACGSYNNNTEMRVRYVGRFADELIVRGSRYNTGDGLRMALAIGAQPAGQWGDYHSTVMDARAPKVEGGETNINAFPYTIIVNKLGKRFLDEGADFMTETYVKYGKELYAQPDNIAFIITDQAARDTGLVKAQYERFLPPIKADSIRELAQKLGLDPETLQKTMDDYNAGVQPGEFRPFELDGKHTVGVEPPKSNWALKVEVPPFYSFPVTGGFTFSFGGLKTNTEAQVLDTEGNVIPGLYAAGEIVGEIIYYNYPGATSLARGAVYGRVAGTNAGAETACSPSCSTGRA